MAPLDYVEMGYLALRNGDGQEAVNIFRRALEGRKSARAWRGLGIACCEQEDLPTARWALYKSLELEEGNQETYAWLAKVEQAPRREYPRERRAPFRVGADYLEVEEAGRWRPFFVKGINLGLGLPGWYPGEYAIRRGTYRQWFRQMGELGANVVRVYTLQPPSFYEALADFNRSGGRLFLIQGVWLELPEGDDFRAPSYLEYLHRQLREAVDAVYGAITLPERPGLPHGEYGCDVSPWTAAFLVGREWEACSVRAFNARSGNRPAEFRGSFLELRGGTPFEGWIAATADFLQSYEQGRYGCSRPVSVNNWPTLDPLVHPSESDKFEELLADGEPAGTEPCAGGYRALQEDAESLDVARIRSVRGGGFFAAYHPYPYYPDFMNNDYLTEENTYLAYLLQLKRHHGRQPVLAAEFGVPSSREPAHWHRDGWHHGGHDEVAQGRIDGLMLESIHQAGLAGAILFAWQDEWFKRNWMFLPYELPAERNAFWFNSQDAEQNYGLLATYPGYPGKRVTLAGRADEWREATVLAAKTEEGMLHRFHDGADEGRRLVRLAAQHDEGFLYLCLTTAGTVDFSRGHYLVGLSTVSPEIGEFLLPCATGARSPVALTYLVHLAGQGQSRILACAAYERYLNVGSGTIRPVPSQEGAWVVMLNETNKRRVSKDGSRFYPPHVFSMSDLRHGSLDRRNPAWTSLADFYVSGRTIELRIPWNLLNVTDPSSRTVLWREGRESTRRIDGIRCLAVSYKPEAGALSAARTGRETNLTDALPGHLERREVRPYVWEGWDCPVYHSYPKESFRFYREALARIPEEPR